MLYVDNDAAVESLSAKTLARESFLLELLDQRDGFACSGRGIPGGPDRERRGRRQIPLGGRLLGGAPRRGSRMSSST